jgi:hypothetical protein
VSQLQLVWDSATQSTTRAAVPVPDYRSGTATVTSGATSVTVTFSSAIANTNYAPICTWMNTTDATPQLQSVMITAFSTTGFTAKWAAPIDTANYKLNWICLNYG